MTGKKKGAIGKAIAKRRNTKREKQVSKYPYKKMVLPKDLVDDSKCTGKLKEDELKKTKNGGRMWTWAAIAFNQMYVDAEKAGVKLQNIGDYRPYEAQLSLFKQRYAEKPNGRVPEVTRKWEGKTWYLKKGMSPCSTPGASNHGLGLAMDINVTDKKVANWLCENAPKYGFYLQGSDPKSPEFELWHWQYVEGDNPPAEVKARYEARQAAKAAGGEG